MSEHFPHIVEEECIACGTCEELCPEVFRINEGLGFAQVVNPGGGSEDKIQEAIDACPVQCIHWTNQG
jgi:ferredoxin